MNKPLDPEAERHIRMLTLGYLHESAAYLRVLAESCPNDIRALGWSVAVHNDYRINGEPHTFWLFTKDGRAVKGEGRTDADALREVRTLLARAAE